MSPHDRQLSALHGADPLWRWPRMVRASYRPRHPGPPPFHGTCAKESLTDDLTRSALLRPPTSESVEGHTDACCVVASCSRVFRIVARTVFRTAYRQGRASEELLESGIWLVQYGVVAMVSASHLSMLFMMFPIWSRVVSVRASFTPHFELELARTQILEALMDAWRGPGIGELSCRMFGKWHSSSCACSICFDT